MQEQLESKDREVRGQTLAAQQAQRKLKKIKAAAHKAVAGVDARLAEAAASAEARCKQLEAARVHLMLCVIKEPAACGGRQQQQSRQQVLPVPGSEVGVFRVTCVLGCGVVLSTLTRFKGRTAQ